MSVFLHLVSFTLLNYSVPSFLLSEPLKIKYIDFCRIFLQLVFDLVITNICQL